MTIKLMVITKVSYKTENANYFMLFIFLSLRKEEERFDAVMDFVYQSIELFDWTFFVSSVGILLSLHQKQKQV